MNLKNACYIVFTLLLTVQLGFAQGKDEAFFHGRPDPVKSIQVYPNPATEFVSVKFEAPFAKKVKLSFHNILGNAIELEQEIMDEHEIRIRVKDLTTGYYFVSVQDEQSNFKSTYKFLKR
jgi:hypothetical protein